MAQATGLTRRTFLKVGAAAGGGLAIGLYLPSYLGMSEETTAASEAFEPNVWIQIGTDDTVTITLTQLEMGQGVMTSMPMLIAEELDMDWQKLDTVWAPADPVYGNPGFGGSQSTAGSRSVPGYVEVVSRCRRYRPRHAGHCRIPRPGASAENECSSEKGEVIHSSTGRRLKYGQLRRKGLDSAGPRTSNSQELRRIPSAGPVPGAPRYSREGQRQRGFTASTSRGLICS